MSYLGVSNEENDLNFKWGTMKGRGRNDRDIQFYDSFTYNGVQYHLYDCAIFYQEGDLETSIGKLVKLYETPNHERKVKVVWFLRPNEIRNLLGSIKPQWNEIFLACGEGQGLFNVNNVGAVIGKCNVVCTSNDERNPPTSEEDLNTAEYIFYRGFDVEKQTISDKFPERIDSIKADHFFNRKNDQNIALNTVKANVEEHNKCLNSPSKFGLYRKIHNGVNNHMLIGSNNVKACVEEWNIFPNSPSKRGLDRVNDHKLTAPNNVKAVAEEKTKYSSSPSKIRLDKVGHNEVRDDKSNSSLRLVIEGSKKHVASAVEQSDIQPYKKRKPLQNAEGSTTTWNMAPLEEKSFDGIKRVSDKAIPKFPWPNGVKTEIKSFEVTRRPDAERRSWFRQSPWEEKLETARESGTLVLLENLDPSYTSFEIEDIIWSALEERVEAKMIQRSTFSSPHYGKALVIFKSREVADKALQTLRNRCLMLSDGRPVVARRKTRVLPGKSESFAGHLTLEQSKFQKQREERRNAVSTSHCSQPNTSEYDFAVEWRLLYEKSDLWWEALHKQQEEEIQNIKEHVKKVSS